MRRKEKHQSSYEVHDLANPHFQHAEVVTENGERMQGQFVKLLVTENRSGYRVYPSEKLCFLPEENKREFWDAFKANGGIFSELPWYIKEFGLNSIREILVRPALLV